MRLSLAILVLVGAHASAEPRRPSKGIEGCVGQDLAQLDRDIAAKAGATYHIAGTALRVCVDKAWYPYAAKKGHQLLACYTVVSGPARNLKRVCGTGPSFVDYRGYRIKVWMRTPRYTEESDVWLRIDKAPAFVPNTAP